MQEVAGSNPAGSTPVDQVRFLSGPRMGRVAQRKSAGLRGCSSAVEQAVRTRKVRGSNPLFSTLGRVAAWPRREYREMQELNGHVPVCSPASSSPIRARWPRLPCQAADAAKRGYDDRINWLWCSLEARRVRGAEGAGSNPASQTENREQSRHALRGQARPVPVQRDVVQWKSAWYCTRCD
jgi:hypothetical protein